MQVFQFKVSFDTEKAFVAAQFIQDVKGGQYSEGQPTISLWERHPGSVQSEMLGEIDHNMLLFGVSQ